MTHINLENQSFISPSLIVQKQFPESKAQVFKPHL